MRHKATGEKSGSERKSILCKYSLKKIVCHCESGVIMCEWSLRLE